MNITKPLTNYNIIFSRQEFSCLNNHFSNIFRRTKDTFEKFTVAKQNKKFCKKWPFITVLSAASIGLVSKIKNLCTKSQQKDILLCNFLDKKAHALSNSTEVLKTNTKNLYEEHLRKFRKLFATPDSKLPQNIKTSVLEIENAKTIQEMFDAEDKAVTGIYKWYKNSMGQQKSTTKFAEDFKKFKKELSKGVKKLQKEAISKLETPIDVPKDLRKAKHAKQILQNFNNEVLNHEKYKIGRLSDYVDTIAEEDTKALFIKYNEDFDRILMTKNRALAELVKITGNTKDKILSGEKTLKTYNVTNNLPESITGNKFFQFVNIDKKDSQTWMDFVKNDMGKDLSYKDIDILEQRLLLRKDISIDEKTIDKFKKDKNILLEFFQKTVKEKAPKALDEQNLSGIRHLAAVGMANSIKDKYGESSFLCMVKDLTDSFFIESDSLLFKLESELNKYSEKYNKSFFDRLLIREKDYFNWEEIL